MDAPPTATPAAPARRPGLRRRLWDETYGPQPAEPVHRRCDRRRGLPGYADERGATPRSTSTRAEVVLTVDTCAGRVPFRCGPQGMSATRKELITLSAVPVPTVDGHDRRTGCGSLGRTGSPSTSHQRPLDPFEIDPVSLDGIGRRAAAYGDVLRVVLTTTPHMSGAGHRRQCGARGAVFLRSRDPGPLRNTRRAAAAG